MEYELSELEKLKIIYQEVIAGYSESSKGYFVRHLSDLHHINVLRKRIEFFNKYIGEGIPSEKEKLQSLIEREEWSTANEEKILELKYNITDNEKNLPNLIPQQHPVVKKVIEQKRKELASLTIERQELLGLTADSASEKDTYNYLIYISLFKDRACLLPLFDKFDDFLEIDDKDVEEYGREIENLLSRFKDNSLMKIAVLPFFLNPFSYSKEAIHTFIHKPISELTNYQMLLFSMGARNLNILSQAEGDPPELMDDIPLQKIVDWYDQNYSIILGKRKSAK